MPTARYPVLICRDLAGGHSAVAVDDGTVGFGQTPRDATADLRDYLRWFHRTTGALKGPDFLDAELRWFAVNVRPEYKGKDRVFRAESAVEVRVPVVVGAPASGSCACSGGSCRTRPSPGSRRRSLARSWTCTPATARSR